MKLKLRKYISLIGTSVGVAMITVTNRAMAEIGSLSPEGSGDDFSNVDSGTDFFQSIAGQVISYISLLAGVLAVIYLIWNGIQYITSSGNADKAKNARQGIINAVIGIIVIVAAYYIIRLAVGIGKTGGNVIGE